MSDNFRTILLDEMDEMYINKSKFISHSFSVKSEEIAQQYINSIKTKYKDATHNVYAYVVGNEYNIQRYSDDGEPSGTAGIPILNYMKSISVTNTLIVVTRYFGGIKLGTGGLARAYSKSAKSVIEKSQIVTSKLFAKITLIFDYNFLGKIENYMFNDNIYVYEKEFSDKVKIAILIDNEYVYKVKASLIEITGNNIDTIIEDIDYYLFKDDKIFNV